MNNEEKILEMLGAIQSEIGSMRAEMDSKFAAVQSEIAEMKSQMAEMQSEIAETNGKLDDLIEAHDETRTCVNAILEWTEKVSAATRLPLPRI